MAIKFRLSIDEMECFLKWLEEYENESFLLKYKRTDMQNMQRKNQMRQIQLGNCIELTKEKDSRPQPKCKDASEV